MKRRAFLAEVGGGMLIASVGSALALDLGLASSSLADDSAERLSFGPLESLAALMEETPIEKFLPAIMEKRRAGATRRQLVAAAALANARAFGGQDYEGYHAFMALLPAFQMSEELEGNDKLLPILKVLYRNTSHIQQMGGLDHETLHPVAPETSANASARVLLEAERGCDMAAAERIFASMASADATKAFNGLQLLIRDNINVHRVVLAWRAWAMLGLTGSEHAHTLLRQSVRYCVSEETNLKRHGIDETLRTQLPALIDRVESRSNRTESKRADAAWVAGLGKTIYSGSRLAAAEAVADALAEGYPIAAASEALAWAGCRLVLCDKGRASDESPDKRKGSVHGASVGVHASDAANAWRNIAQVSEPRNAVAAMIVGAYHTAGQSAGQAADPVPAGADLDRVNRVSPESLLTEIDAAVRGNDQAMATALMGRYESLELPSRPAFDLLRKYAVSEDGALHAEKYYRTVTEEFAAARPEFRRLHLSALARVTASEYGKPAPGVAEAKSLLKA